MTSTTPPPPRIRPDHLDIYANAAAEAFPLRRNGKRRRRPEDIRALIAACDEGDEALANRMWLRIPVTERRRIEAHLSGRTPPMTQP